MSSSSGVIKVGVDTGGTFTDFAVMDVQGRCRRLKILSTPSDPSRAIIEGFMKLSLLPVRRGTDIVHGTTVGTNAFLERKGARTVLITTAGFEDVLFIGRQNRPALYDFMVQKPAPIIHRNHIFGVRERMAYDGKVIIPLEEQDIEDALEFCRSLKPESVAICFLHSYANPEHEVFMQERLSDALNIPVTTSSSVLPEFREYERLCTTLINAYLNPVVGNYIRRLSSHVEGAGLYIQQSNGGCLPADSMGDRAVTTLLSGPAGGVQAAWRQAESMGIDNIITFDMGGTSTDVSLCSGGLTYTRDYRIDDYPVALPIIDIHTVGAGGGSIAWIDRGGLMQVGPRSAGADPGPVCYGKGSEITVTDANLFLGRLRAESFLGGGMRLYTHRLEPAFEELGAHIGLDARETALGVISLVNNSMVQAIRAVSVERGYDPVSFSLFCYGGAAGLHACEVADALEIRRIIVPERAGVFSAQGMADADLVFERSAALVIRGAEHREDEIEEHINSLVEALKAEVSGSGNIHGQEFIKSEAFVDCRYHGQSFELTIKWGPNWRERFENLHRRLYGHAFSDRGLEVTAVRVKVIVERRCPRSERNLFAENYDMSRLPEFVPDDSLVDEVIFSKGPEKVNIVSRVSIEENFRVIGPAVIIDDFTTVLIPETWSAANLSESLVLEKYVW